MREYTLLGVVSVLAVVALELGWLRTGLFRDRAYWIALAVCLVFMVAVDGWLTKLSAPIVLYASDGFSGIRIPWDIPIEDYLFGFSLLTLAMLVWDRAGRSASLSDR